MHDPEQRATLVDAGVEGQAQAGVLLMVCPTHVEPTAPGMRSHARGPTPPCLGPARACLTQLNAHVTHHLAAGFLYDSSLADTAPSPISPSVTQRGWPYKMDGGIPQTCSTGGWRGCARCCPQGSTRSDAGRHAAAGWRCRVLHHLSRSKHPG